MISKKFTTPFVFRSINFEKQHFVLRTCPETVPTDDLSKIHYFLISNDLSFP